MVITSRCDVIKRPGNHVMSGLSSIFEEGLLAWNRGGVHLYLKLDIILEKKIHVIRVVFQDQAIHARTSFLGANTCKIGKKGVFLFILTNFGKDMMDKLRKTHAEMHI